jgi:hypothetical protein
MTAAFSTRRMNWIVALPSVTDVRNSRTVARCIPPVSAKMSKLDSFVAPSIRTSNRRLPAPFWWFSAKCRRTSY